MLTSARKDVGRDRVVFLGGRGHYLVLVCLSILFYKALEVMSKIEFCSSI